MKKLLLILLLSPLLSFGQNDSLMASETEVERIIDKYSGKITDAFNSGIEKITPMAEEGFELLVRLKIAEGIIGMLPLFAFIISFRIFLKEYKRIAIILSGKVEDIPPYMDKEYGPFSEVNNTVLLVMSVIFSIVLFFLSLFCTSYGIRHLIAPEWYAIKEILELF